MSAEAHQVNIFARYEELLFSGDKSKSKVIPAVVITGFLGSGKTTLVHHILRNRGSLRIAVLVNEVGQIDVDSKLVNAKQANAALGLPAIDLSGGCVCCSRAEDLAAALRGLRAPPAAAAPGPSASPSFCQSSSATCDYLLVETSGAADAGPLAEALTAAGFRLDAVVAVVDAEAGRQALGHPVAHAQLSCADVVVLNKCDLVAPSLGQGFGGSGMGLGPLADMEDMLAEMAPGIRVVRARYGEVPLTVLLDVEPVGAGEGDDGREPPAAVVATTAGDGSGGFMSHESVPAGRGGTGAGSYRLASGPCTADGMAVGSSRHTKRRTQAGLAITATHPKGIESHQHPHGHRSHNSHNNLHSGPEQVVPVTTGESRGGAASAISQAADSAGGAPQLERHNHDHVHREHAHGDHARLHSGFYTESLTVADRPCSLVAFADYAVRRLVKEPALLRSKGVMWFGERRGHRFTFHLSGRRRLEVAQEGPWEGPPASHLVLIGTDAAAMRRLRDAFLVEVASVMPARKPIWALAHGANEGGPSLISGGVGGDEVAGAGSKPADSDLEAAAACIAAQERLELLACERWGLSEAPLEAPGLDGGGNGCSAKVTEGGPSAPAASEQMVEVSGWAGGGGSGSLLNFTTRGSALHGINSEELNAELMRRTNASGMLLLVAVTAPGRISAVTNVQARDRVVSLLFACKAFGAQEQAGLCVKTFAEPLLRKAFAHVHSCKCDVVCGPTVM